MSKALFVLDSDPDPPPSGPGSDDNSDTNDAIYSQQRKREKVSGCCGLQIFSGTM
jgi:hypothetical protein